MIKLKQYSDDYWKKLLTTRLRDAQVYRRDVTEDTWFEAERTIGYANGLMHEEHGQYANISYEDMESYLQEDDREGAVSVNYAFKNLRYLHAQMSSNPPSVAIRPTSSDPKDKRRADAADRLCRHALRAYNLQEIIDLGTNKVLTYGTGWMKTEWDKDAGEFEDFTPDGACKMQGDINIYSPSVWDIWIEPRAKTWDKVVWMFERKEVSRDEAEARFPDAGKLIHQTMDKRNEDKRMASRENMALEEKYFIYYEYYEKGTPYNAMQGRHTCMLEDGTMLREMGPSPFRFATAPEGDELEATIRAQEEGIIIDPPHEIARLPYHILTDIDVADQVYGKSFLYYEIPIQDALNRLDTTTMDNCKVHGKVTIAIPDTAELDKDALTNNTLNIIRHTQGSAPTFLKTPSLMPDMSSLRDRLKQGGDDVAGVSPANFGQTEREQSGHAMQYASNQSNTTRRRLFNKYTLWVESIHIGYLDLIRKHWKTSRVVRVLGDEKAFEAVDIKGSDISGGYDFKVEYGTNFSLDPTARREELATYTPMLKEGGLSGKEILKMARFNDLGTGLDMAELADNRQAEIFEQIVAGGGKIYIKPREMSDHEGMIAFGYKYIMTNEFRKLPETVKQLIEMHIKDRESILAGDATKAAGPAGPAGAAPDMGGGQPPQPPQVAPIDPAGAQMGEGASLPAVPSMPT